MITKSLGSDVNKPLPDAEKFFTYFVLALDGTI